MSKIITIYQDLDGCFCDFKKAFGQQEFDKELFKKKVFEDKIFETLDWMPNGKMLFDMLIHLKENVENINIEILTSLGCGDDFILGEEVRKQKLVWLKNMGVDFPSNFVNYGTLKAHYANKNSVLIDDTEKVVEAFMLNKGYAILHKDDNISSTAVELNLWLLNKSFGG